MSWWCRNEGVRKISNERCDCSSLFQPMEKFRFQQDSTRCSGIYVNSKNIVKHRFQIFKNIHFHNINITYITIQNRQFKLQIFESKKDLSKVSIIFSPSDRNFFPFNPISRYASPASFRPVIERGSIRSASLRPIVATPDEKMAQGSLITIDPAKVQRNLGWNRSR